MIEAEGTALPKPGTKAQCGADTEARIVDLLVRADDASGSNCWRLGLLLVMVATAASVLRVPTER
jgi:hypothetical protein